MDWEEIVEYVSEVQTALKPVSFEEELARCGDDRDREAVAIEQVADALLPLAEDARARVARWVWSRYGH